jgi:hypothetical protein
MGKWQVKYDNDFCEDYTMALKASTCAAWPGKFSKRMMGADSAPLIFSKRPSASRA